MNDGDEIRVLAMNSWFPARLKSDSEIQFLMRESKIWRRGGFGSREEESRDEVFFFFFFRIIRIFMVQRSEGKDESADI